VEVLTGPSCNFLIVTLSTLYLVLSFIRPLADNLWNSCARLNHNYFLCVPWFDLPVGSTPLSKFPTNSFIVFPHIFKRFDGADPLTSQGDKSNTGTVCMCGISFFISVLGSVTSYLIKTATFRPFVYMSLDSSSSSPFYVCFLCCWKGWRSVIW